MISIIQAAILGLIQGLTELFPISSLGHSVIIPSLLGWHIQQNASYFLTFLVATHAATALALFLFFWRDWVEIIKGIFRSLINRHIDHDDTYAKLGWLLIVATVPAGILGLAFQKKIGDLFASAQIAAAFLIVNGLILFAAEWLRTSTNRRRTREQTDASISKLSWWQSAGIGVAQAFALIPGISRSGISMAGGLFVGLDNEAAARFSFLLATPVIGAAALLKLPDIAKHTYDPLRGAFIVGAVCSGIAAYLSTRFLIKYFQTKTLTPFAVYCVIAGTVYSVILFVR